MASRRRFWLLVRIAVYLTVIVGLILFRGGVPWKRFKAALQGAGQQHPTLAVAGRDLAPPLLERLATEYRRDYPALTMTLLPGGTNQALEMLLAHEADAAFLLRPPTAEEQALFRAADGDTAVVVAVGVGGLVLLAGSQAPTGPVTVADLRVLLGRGEPAVGAAPSCDRIYACDPNEGSWDAFLGALGLAPAQVEIQVVYLATPAAVLEAVAADPHAWGVVSTLDGGLDPEIGPPAGTKFVGVAAANDQGTVSPTAANIASGDYPLYHFLYVACRGAGSLEGGKFVTHLASARGSRQVERAGVIPARLVARTIQLSRDPVGAGSKQGDGQ